MSACQEHSFAAMFLYAGAVDALERMGHELSRPIWDRWQGHIGLAESIAELAHVVVEEERLGAEAYNTFEVGYPSVFAYDLIEPAGAWLALHPEANEHAFRAYLRENIEKFFEQ